MLAKQALYPAIKLPAIYAFKLDPHAGLDERANRFLTLPLQNVSLVELL